MNKQKINAYLEESLQPWKELAGVIYSEIDIPLIPIYIDSSCYVNEYIKYLIEDKS